MGDLLVDVTGAHQVQEATATFHAEEINRGMTFSAYIFTKKIPHTLSREHFEKFKHLPAYTYSTVVFVMMMLFRNVDVI